MRCLRVVLALATLVGCAPSGAGSADGGASGADANPFAPDADPYGPDAGSSCATVPDPSPSWLTAYQQEIVGKLSGNIEISPGTTLPDRATGARRTIVRNYLAGELTTLGYTAQRHTYDTGENVYAELPAAGAGKPWVVIGAHFDSVSGAPGANDNATGVAVVMALARYLRAVDCRQINVMFVFFDQEEVGLVGSTFFAGWLQQSGLDVAAVHTVDQMGWDMDGDRAIELERPDTGLYELYSAATSAGGLSVPLVETQTGSTDHVSFRQKGFAAVGITEEYAGGDTTPYYHTPGDTYATVNFAYLASTTALVDYTFAAMATGALDARPASGAFGVARPTALPGAVRRFESIR